MRRVGGTATAKVAATGAVLVALLTGCMTQAANAPAPRTTAVSPTADSSGATATVCKQIRSDLASRMSSLGEALGDYLGYRAADDDDAVEDARVAVTAQVKEIGVGHIPGWSGRQRLGGREGCVQSLGGHRSGRGQQRLVQRPRLAVRHSGRRRQDQRCCSTHR